MGGQYGHRRTTSDGTRGQAALDRHTRGTYQSASADSGGDRAQRPIRSPSSPVRARLRTELTQKKWTWIPTGSCATSLRSSQRSPPRHLQRSRAITSTPHGSRRHPGWAWELPSRSCSSWSPQQSCSGAETRACRSRAASARPAPHPRCRRQARPRPRVLSQRLDRIRPRRRLPRPHPRLRQARSTSCCR